MDAWVYVLSKFTQEALLFEALVLFLGFAAYGAYFVTRKRKYGVAQSEVPSNLVKVYLAQLVADAEDLRIQLFGLLGRGSVDASFLNQLGAHAGASAHAHAAPMAHAAPTASAPAGASTDPFLLEKLKDLELKMAEQAKALENVLNEKTRLEQELALARQASTSAAPSGATGDDASLAERIRQLEAQLSEYAIIEDDLANLKRLQRENKDLRAQLEKLGTAGAQTAAPTPAPAAEPAPVAVPVAAAPAEPTPAPVVAAAAPAPSSDVVDGAPDFDALVDQVEKSLEAAPEIPKAAEAPAENVQAKTEKELQDEFEKMLNA
jgi:hypothetical protein